MGKKFMKSQGMQKFKNKAKAMKQKRPEKARYENRNEKNAKWSKKIHKQNKPINVPNKKLNTINNERNDERNRKNRKEKKVQKVTKSDRPEFQTIDTADSSSNSKSKNKKNNNKIEDQEIMTDNKENFFVYDTDTNIFNKLKGEKTQKRKMNTWNYNKVIEEEKQIQSYKDIENNNKKGEGQSKKKEKEKVNDEVMDIDDIDDGDDETGLEENINITKYENDLFAKDTKFTDFTLTKLLIKACSDQEIYTPTKVQEKVIPIILKGNDVLVNSETGSGKTACYLLPILQKIYQSKNSKSETKALVILPTRELVFQCAQMLSSFLKYADFITFVAVSGGMSVEKQELELKSKPDIILATPGRLIDLIYNHKAIDIENINILVLDEADKLLELGFKDAIFEIIKLINKNLNIRQTLLFSATLNTKVLDLEKHALKNPVRIKLVHSAVLTNLKQSMVRMRFKLSENDENHFEKRMSYLLFLLLGGEVKNRTIIFFNTKLECHKAGIVFRNYNLKFAELHGSISQPERLKSLNDFQAGEISYLLATDIAARGIDIEKVKYVINFQMPVEMDRYTHRIGRTARKGYLGNSITICNEDDRYNNKSL